MTARILRQDAWGMKEAIRLMARGEVVILPSALLYGLACRAEDADAVARLNALKGRERPRPVPLFATPTTAGQAAFVGADVARAMEFLWPGGVSFLLKRRPNVPRHVSGSDTVLLVCPDAWSLALGERAGFPIAATSANPSGAPPCLTAEDAFARFGNAVNLIVDGGRAAVGLHTTIVDWTGERPRVARTGAMDPREIGKAIPMLAQN